MFITTLALGFTLLQQKPELKTVDTKVGTGTAVVRGDEVSVDYVGKFTDGKIFDQSKGAPFKVILGLGNVIQGWDKGLVGMKVGGVRELTVPPEMGYGARQVGEIPPNSTLKFTVTLKAVAHPREKLTITVVQAGTGEGANWDEAVSLDYIGKLDDGTEFDNSIKRKEPLKITIGKTRLIPGFTLGVVGIKKGETRSIKIPAALGYGARGVGPIPPNSVLTFIVTRV